jgi:DNA-binding transcriptional ArsR family regulator
MSLTSFDSTPSELPADSTDSAGSSKKANELVFDWAALVPLVVHPLKVAIVEAMLCLGQPLSATDISKSFGAAGNGLSYVSYHVTSLAKAGVIRKVSERQGRGAREKFYFFP